MPFIRTGFVPLVSVVAAVAALFAGCQGDPNDLQQRYDVELASDAAGNMLVKLAPGDALVAATVEEVDVTPAVTVWDVRAPSGASGALSADTYLTLGSVPVGWTVSTPYAALVEGKTYQVTLKGSAPSQASATWVYHAAPVTNPSLYLNDVDGELELSLLPSVPVSSVTLLDSTGTSTLWQATAQAGAGLLFPVEGLIIGNAPSTWTAEPFNTNLSLVNGATYQLRIVLGGTGTVLNQSFTFTAGSPSTFELTTGGQVYSSSWINGSFYDFRVLDHATGTGQVTAFLPTLTSVSPASHGWFALDNYSATGTMTQYLPTPNSGPWPISGGTNLQSFGQMSQPVLLADDRVAVAYVTGPSGATAGSLVVAESVKGPSSFNGLFDLGGPFLSYTQGWTTLGTAVGSFPISNLSPRLVRKPIAGLASMNSSYPYVAAAGDFAGGLGIYYFNQAGAWISIPVAGLFNSGETLQGFDLAVTDSGTLYGYVAAQGTSGFMLRLMSYNPASATWTSLSSTTNGIHVQGPRDYTTPHLTTAGDTVYGIALSVDSTGNSSWQISKCVAGTVSSIPLDVASLLGTASHLYWIFDFEADSSGLYFAALDFTSPTLTGATTYAGYQAVLLHYDGASWSLLKRGRAPIVNNEPLNMDAAHLSADKSTLVMVGHQTVTDSTGTSTTEVGTYRLMGH